MKLKPRSVLLVLALAVAMIAGTVFYRRAQAEKAERTELAIKINLTYLANAAEMYFLENGPNYNQVTYQQLTKDFGETGPVHGPNGNRFFSSIKPVAGEDYSQLKIEDGQMIIVRTADGREISYGPAVLHLTRACHHLT